MCDDEEVQVTMRLKRSLLNEVRELTGVELSGTAIRAGLVRFVGMCKTGDMKYLGCLTKGGEA